MSNITLSAAVRSNLLSLQNTASLLDTTQTRLATGNKVNSALDNPTSYFTASALNARASDLGNLLDSVSNAIQTIQAANDGITSITKLVESAQATANQAQQLQATVTSTSGAVTESDAVANTSNTTSLTIQSAVTEADVSSNTTNLTSVTIAGAVSESDVSSNTNDLTSVTIAGAVTESDATAASSDITSLTIHDAVTESDASATTQNISSLSATGGTITINGQNVVVGAGDTGTDVYTALQGAATAGGFTVNDNLDGTYSITSNGGNDLDIGGDSTTLTELGLSAGTTPGTPPVTGTSGNITINGQTISLADGDTSATIASKFSTAAGLTSGSNAFTVDFTGGVLTVTGTGGNDLNIGGNAATLSAVGLSSGTVNGTAPSAGTAGNITINGQTISLSGGDNLAAITTKLQNAALASSGTNAFTVAASSGVLTITGAGGNDLDISGNAATLSALGLSSGSQDGTPASAGTAGNITINGQTIALANGDDLSAITTKLQTAATASSGTNAFTVSASSGVLTITGAGGNDLTIGGNAATLSAVGLSSGTQNGTTPVTGTAGNITINGQTISLANGDNSAAILTKLQTAATASSGTNAFTVSNASGVFTLTGTGGNDLVVGGNASTLTALGLSSGTINGTPASSGTTIQIANPARAALISQYNGLLDQIDQLTSDAGYNGNNLLTAGSSVKVVFNETGTSSLTISGTDTSSTGLGLAKLNSTDFDSNSNITTILGTLKDAQDTLRADASSFGSNLSIVQTRQDFTKSLINTLQTGASNLTLADSNEEAANLLALQTRQSLSTKALSLASQSDQNVLRLLQ